MSARKPPSYRRAKKKNLAFVRLKNGNNKYLGKYGSPESYRAYEDFVRDWTANGGDDLTVFDSAKPDQTIDELADYFTHKRVTHYYVRDGKPTGEQENFRHALAPLREAFGTVTVDQFDARHLERVQQALVDRGQAASTVNRNMGRIRLMFRWAASKKLFPETRLKAFEGIDPVGRRQGVRETPRVRPAPRELIESALPELSDRVRAIVHLIDLTAARPGEICMIRPVDLDRSDPAVWVYRPEHHKTEHHGSDRFILIGPKAQEVLSPWLGGDREGYCFCPADSVEGDWVGRRRPKPGRPYRTGALRNAIHAACDRAHPHPEFGNPSRPAPEIMPSLLAWRKRWRWNPNQLRHGAATRIRALHGREAAQAILGHARAETTERYAERDDARARSVIREIG